MNIFNKILRTNPSYVVAKDTLNLSHIVLVTSKNNFVKLKFAKYQNMTDKNHFYNAQRIFHILSRFIHFCKVKRFNVFDCDCDLHMNPFDPKTAIELVEKRCIYKFNVKDLINVVVASLNQQIMMFINPQFPKNPYTNLNFSVHNLYNIYAKCMDARIAMPEIVRLFYACDFNIDLFKDKHKRFLIDTSIDNYFSKDLLVTSEIVEYIFDMCDPHNINIHDDFPKPQLYAIFRPYLRLFFKSKILTGENDIRFMLDCFELYNPFFGKRYITESPNEEQTIGFDDRHLSFQEIKNGVFKTIKQNGLFERCLSHKYSYGQHECISLKPIDNVIYENIYEDNKFDYDSEDEDYDSN
jgi:hypothetical protein